MSSRGFLEAIRDWPAWVMVTGIINLEHYARRHSFSCRITVELLAAAAEN